MINKVISIILLICVSASSNLFAEGVVMTSNVNPVDSKQVFTIVAGLLFIVALILIAGWLSRKYMGVAGIGKGAIRIISGLSLGGKDRIVVVEVGGEQLLLGVSTGRIEKLHILKEKVEVHKTIGNSNSFFDKLNQEIKKKTSNG